MTSTRSLPFARCADADTTRLYLSQRQTLLATAAETGGAFALVEETVRAGLEPPPHVHTREDEAFYLIDGDVEFQVGERTLRATPGTFVFLPRGVPHAFRVLTPTARLLVLLTPGGFERFFQEMARPLTDDPAPPTPDEFGRLLATAPTYGIQWAEAGAT